MAHTPARTLVRNLGTTKVRGLIRFTTMELAQLVNVAVLVHSFKAAEGNTPIRIEVVAIRAVNTAAIKRSMAAWLKASYLVRGSAVAQQTVIRVAWA